jgi:RNA polymerase sigma factor (TIGR02999 family)
MECYAPIRNSGSHHDVRWKGSGMADVTSLLNEARSGSSSSAHELFELLYTELRSLAHQQARRHAEGAVHTTTLVHEAYLRFRSSGNLQIADQRHFLAYASHVMRSIVVDQARGRLAAKRGAGSTPLTLDTGIIGSTVAGDAEVIKIHEALAELTALDQRLGKIVEMKYFGGMTENEIAEALELSARTVQRDWEKARLFLSAALQQR